MEIARAIGTATTFLAAGLFAPSAQPSTKANESPRPVRIVVPTLPGSGIDFAAEVIAEPLAARLGRPVVRVNVAGAATIAGSELVARAAPDGNTLLVTSSALATNPSIRLTMPYDALRDFAPITQIAMLPMLLVAHRSLPVKSVQELTALASTKPIQVSFATPGHGSSPHLYMELLLGMTRVRMHHMTYEGPRPAIESLLVGNTSVMIMSTVVLLPHVRSGRLRALGVTSPRRTSVAPGVPTLAEAGVPGYEAAQWWGLLTAAAVPKAVLATLQEETTAVLRQRDVTERFAQEGAEVVASSPGEFAEHIRTQIEKWSKVVKSAGISPPSRD